MIRDGNFRNETKKKITFPHQDRWRESQQENA